MVQVLLERLGMAPLKTGTISGGRNAFPFLAAVAIAAGLLPSILIGQLRRPSVPQASADVTVRAGGSALGSAPNQPVTEYHLPGAAAPAEDPAGLIIDIVGKLALVIGLIFVCALGSKKLQANAPKTLAPAAATDISVASTVALAPQRFLHLVNIGDRRLLVGSSPQQVTFLADLREPTPATASGSAAAEPAKAEPGSVVEAPQSELTARDRRFGELLEQLRSVMPAPKEEMPVARPADPVCAALVNWADQKTRDDVPASMPAEAPREERSVSQSPRGGSLVAGTLFRSAGRPNGGLDA